MRTNRPAWLTLAHVVRMAGIALAFIVVCGIALLAGTVAYATYLALKLWIWPS